MPPLRVAVLASGHGSNLQALLDAFREPAAPARIALVVSNKPAAGALERARHAGVATATIPEDGRDADALLALLARHDIALVVLAGYLKRVPDRVVAAVGTRSRLPRLPWYIPAAAGPERPATAPPAAHPESVSPVTTTPRSSPCS